MLETVVSHIARSTPSPASVLVPLALLVVPPAQAQICGIQSPDDRSAASPAGTDACPGLVAWEQLSDGEVGYASQEDLCYPFQAEVVDDIEGGLGVGGRMTGLAWWGDTWCAPPLPPDYFRVRMYTDDGGRPGTEIFVTDLLEYNEVLGAPHSYCSFFDTPFDSQDGVTYWMSVQAVYCFPPQWGWVTGVGNGVDIWMRFPLVGYDDWTPGVDIFGVVSDMSFLGYTEDVTPMVSDTWSELKRAYR